MLADYEALANVCDVRGWHLELHTHTDVQGEERSTWHHLESLVIRTHKTVTMFGKVDGKILISESIKKGDVNAAAKRILKMLKLQQRKS